MECSDTHFVVYFNRTALDERTNPSYNNRSYSLKFTDASSPDCRVDFGDISTIGRDLDASVPHDMSFPSIYLGTTYAVNICGIQITSDLDYIYYNTTVTVVYGENPAPHIGREEYDNYIVTCLRNRTIQERFDSYDVQTRLNGIATQSK